MGNLNTKDELWSVDSTPSVSVEGAIRSGEKSTRMRIGEERGRGHMHGSEAGAGAEEDGGEGDGKPEMRQEL